MWSIRGLYNFSWFKVAFNLSPTPCDYQSLYRITSCRHLIFLNIRHGCNHYVVSYSFSPSRSLRTIIVLFFFLLKNFGLYILLNTEMLLRKTMIFCSVVLYNESYIIYNKYMCTIPFSYIRDPWFHILFITNIC